MSKESDDLMALYNEHMDTSSDVRENFKNIPFSYPGTKKDSLANILPRLPYLKVFVDVFAGSGVVTLNRKESPLDVYNDRHSGVTAFFRVVRDNQLREQLIERIGLTVHGREEFIWSKSWPLVEDPVERAARWFTCVQSSFVGRGQYFGRVLKGQGNMWRKIQENLDLFQDIAQRFLRVQIENLDWRHCLKDYDSYDTVFYIDPPYWEHNIYEHKMTKEDHREMLDRIFQCKGFVAVSGYENALYDSYDWDGVVKWEVYDKMTTQAFSETSCVHGHESHVERGIQTEYLFIKEVSA